MKFQQTRGQGASRTAFCLRQGIPRGTLQNWERRAERLLYGTARHPRTSLTNGPVFSRASYAIFGGSSRVADTADIEDALLTTVKAKRRMELTVN